MIYVVDDAADYRFLVQQVFRRFLPNYSLQLFADGLDLIQYVDQHTNTAQQEQAKPSLIVLDVDMPKLNGFQTLERLRQNPFWQTVPVVMMSSRVESDFSKVAYEMGANSYVFKPMSLPELQNVMGQLCHQWLD